MYANPPVEDALKTSPTIEERRALIHRIAGSAQFRRSARLRDFLTYVGGQSLKAGCPEIHEYEIGAKVFGRPAAYDRSQDNIVRVNATELRKRIDLYFATEGANEPLILEIPRGGYKPVFHWRPVQTTAQPESQLESLRQPGPVPSAAHSPEPAQPSAPAGTRVHFAWSAISIILAIVSLILVQQNRALRASLNPWEGKPAVAALWSDLLRLHQQTDIILPDASVSIGEEILGHPTDLAKYLSHNYMVQADSENISPDRRFDLQRVFGHNLVAFGDIRAAEQIYTLTPVSNSLRLTFSRFYTADSIKRDNFILIGGKKANPWMHLFDDKMNFSLGYDSATSESVISNRNPLPGEQAAYKLPTGPNTFVGYSVIAYLPSPSGSGKAIVIAGTDSDTTAAAAEFLTTEAPLERFRNLLHVQQFPYFEALLKTSRLSGTSFNAELIAYRTYPDLH